jgi:hypothetical protein
MGKTPWDDHGHSPPAGMKIFPISKTPVMGKTPWGEHGHNPPGGMKTCLIFETANIWFNVNTG